MLVLSRRDVERALDLGRLVDALAGAMADLSAGTASVPPRVAAVIEDRDAILAAMPGYVGSSRTLAAKLVTVFPHNHELGLDSHQAVIALFDGTNGTPLALLDGTYITAVRTAAGSALSTRLLAREDSSVLAVLGTGVQAWSHARAIPRVRPIREVRVAGRDAGKAEALAAALASEEDRVPVDGLEIRAVASFAEAMAGADVVSAATHSSEPIVRRDHVEPGMHITSVGLNKAGPEVDAPTVADALVVVESRSAALAPFPSGAADLLWPIRDGLVTPEHVHAEIGELVLGAKPGRTSPEQITLYKSVGVAVQDATAAALAVHAAESRGLGTLIEL
jgi:alanine dehydrogenase